MMPPGRARCLRATSLFTRVRGRELADATFEQKRRLVELLIDLDGGPSRRVVGQKAPGAAATRDIEDGVKYLAWSAGTGSSCWFWGGQVGLQIGPFGIG